MQIPVATQEYKPDPERAVNIDKLQRLTCSIDKNLPISYMDFSKFASENFDQPPTPTNSSSKANKPTASVKKKRSSKLLYNECQKTSIYFGITGADMKAYHKMKVKLKKKTKSTDDLLDVDSYFDRRAAALATLTEIEPPQVVQRPTTPRQENTKQNYDDRFLSPNRITQIIESEEEDEDFIIVQPEESKKAKLNNEYALEAEDEFDFTLSNETFYSPKMNESTIPEHSVPSNVPSRCSTPRISISDYGMRPRCITPRCSTPRCPTPRCSTPRCPTPRCSTPRCSTPRCSTPKQMNESVYRPIPETPPQSNHKNSFDSVNYYTSPISLTNDYPTKNGFSKRSYKNLRKFYNRSTSSTKSIFRLSSSSTSLNGSPSQRKCHSVEDTLLADEEFQDYTIPKGRTSFYACSIEDLYFEKHHANNGLGRLLNNSSKQSLIDQTLTNDSASPSPIIHPVTPRHKTTSSLINNSPMNLTIFESPGPIQWDSHASLRSPISIITENEVLEDFKF